MSASSAQILSNEKRKRLERGEDLKNKMLAVQVSRLCFRISFPTCLRIWFQSESGVVSCVLSVVSEIPARFVNACEKDEKKAEIDLPPSVLLP